jgi:magnesium-transporting ATPase (P-type)
MTRRNDVLADRLDAVETLGATGVIRTYKTGTLTKRRMTVSRVALDAADIDSESFAHKAGHEPPGDLPAVETTSGKHRDAGEARQRVRQRRCSSNG